MQGTPLYLHYGFLLISTANLVVILLLLVVFALAVSLRLPGEASTGVVDQSGDDLRAGGSTP